MNRDQFNTNFQQLKPYILDKWNRLTEDDLRQINGRYEALISKVQEKYGTSRDEAEDQFRNWSPNLRFDRERDISSTRKREEEESSSVGKWVLAAGIPFLFLLGYLGTHYNNPAVVDDTRSPSSYDQTLYTKNPSSTDANMTLSQNVRKVLFANSQLLNDLKDIRIEAESGVVTIYGTVKTDEEKTLVTRIAEKISGVTQVNNKVEVR